MHARGDSIAFLLGLAFAMAPGLSSAHGYIVSPTARTTDAYEVDTGGLYPCGDHPDPGPVQVIWQPGQEIEILLDITLQHLGDPFIQIQLCEDPSPLTSACLVAGEFAALPDDELEGIHVLNTTLPAGVECQACVLRVIWDHSFLGCIDVTIGEPPPVPAASLNGWAGLALIMIVIAAQALRRERASSPLKKSRGAGCRNFGSDQGAEVQP